MQQGHIEPSESKQVKQRSLLNLITALFILLKKQAYIKQKIGQHILLEL